LCLWERIAPVSKTTFVGTNAHAGAIVSARGNASGNDAAVKRAIAAGQRGSGSGTVYAVTTLRRGCCYL
jgi:hypothetical protein